MSDLHNFIRDLGTKKTSSTDVLEAGAFFVGLKKRAEDDLAQAAFPMPEPSEYAVPVESFAQLLAQAVTHLFGNSAAVSYYEALAKRDSYPSAWSDTRWRSDDAAKVLLKRLGSIGMSIEIPPMAPPVPTSDPYEIASVLLERAKRTLVLLQNLRSMAGESPFRFSIEEMIGAWAKVTDSLDNCMPVVAEVSGVEGKVARAMKLAARKLAELPLPGPMDVVAPPPGEEPVESYLLREKELQTAQLANENEFLRQQLQQTQQHAAVQQTQAEEMGAQAADLGSQLEQTQAQVQQTQAEAMQNLELASSAESNAAAQADAKMRLSMRIQQLRQTLADVVSQDPAAEEGAGFPEEAGPGAPMTSVQQQQQAEAAAAADPAAEAAPAPPTEAKEEVEEAQRAEVDAAVQQQQAQEAAGKTAGFFGPTATERMQAADRLSSGDLAQLSNAELGAGKHVGLKPKASIGSRVMGKVRGVSREIGEALGDGLAESAKRNTTPEALHYVGENVGRGVGDAADKSLHDGKLLQRVERMGHGAKRLGQGALAIGAVGTAALGAKAVLKHRAEARKEKRLLEAVKGSNVRAQ